MKQFITTIASIIFFSLLITQSSAQEMIAINKVKSEKNSLPSVENRGYGNTAEGTFSTLFPHATQTIWKITPENSFVFFINDGRKVRASFNEKGAMNYAITTCSIEDLPASFSKTIKTSYADYQLFHAIEIKAYGETAYQVVLESASDFMTLKYTVDGVEEIRLVKKQ